MSTANRREGIQVRHGRSCPASTDRTATCRCKPSFRAEVYDARAKTKIRKTWPTLAAAKAWRADTLGSVRRGTMRAPASTKVRESWETWLADARSGLVRSRSGDVYKPSVLRSYSSSMRLHVLDDFGARKLADITRLELQDLADELLAAGHEPSTIRNTLMPLRVIFKRALERGELAVNPTAGLRLPAVRGRRDRIASPVEAAALIAALPEQDRAVWATALYAGLRLGELQALRDEDVDLAAGVIRVERSWDHVEGVIEPKSRAGTRRVPIVAVLRGHLVAHRLRRQGGEFFFGEEGGPFSRDRLIHRTRKAWKATGLEPLGLHEARHTCASVFIAAGVNLKALSSYLGHSSITVTLDRYGHLMPGNETEAVGLVDAYLERANAVTILDEARV